METAEAVAEWMEDWGMVAVGIISGAIGATWLLLAELQHRRISGLRERDRLRFLLRDLVKELESQPARSQLGGLRTRCANRYVFDLAKMEALSRLLGPVYLAHGVDYQWQVARLPAAAAEDKEIASLGQLFAERCAFGTLGPLNIEKGSCVEVHGLDGEGEPLNGEKGFVKSYQEAQDCYDAIFVIADVGFLNLSLPPTNLRPLSEKDVLHSIHQQQVAVLETEEVHAEICRLRKESKTEAEFLRGREELERGMKPIYQRHGVDAKWCSLMTTTLGATDPEVVLRAKRVEDLFEFSVAAEGAGDAEGAPEEKKKEPGGSERRQLPRRPDRPVWEVLSRGCSRTPIASSKEDAEAGGCSGHLSAGSLLEEVEVEGDLLRFRRLTGSGPDTGWVRLTLEGEELLAKAGKKPLEVWILSVGTRGDFQPFVALAQGLRREGYSVRMLGPENEAGFAAMHGLPFTRVCPDNEQAIQSHTAQGEPSDFVTKLVFEEFDHALFMEELEAARPDLLLHGALGTFWALNAERKFGIPAISAGLQPEGLDGAAPDYNHEEFLSVARASWEDQCKFEAAMVRPAHGVAALSEMGFEKYYKRKHVEGHLIGFLAGLNDFFHALPPRVREVQQRHAYTGFWFLEGPEGDDAEDEELDTTEGRGQLEQVERFLAVGPAVFLGWGSCICRRGPKHMALVAIGALKAAGLRGIVQSGWAGLSLELLREAIGPEDPEGICAYAEANVLFVEQVSHTWLFPRCMCHVHHGGVGTLAASWRAGKPVIVTPVWQDQFMNAELVKLMCGIGAKPLDDLTAEELAGYLKHATSDPSARGTAKMMQASVQQEGGVRDAVAYVNGVVAQELKSGRWHRRWRSSGCGWREDFGMSRSG